jgi:hypothetical protein
MRPKKISVIVRLFIKLLPVYKKASYLSSTISKFILKVSYALKKVSAMFDAHSLDAAKKTDQDLFGF